MDIQLLIFLMGMGFMASFIDSVVGGGGLISIPALMWTGLPPLQVLGTNKVAAVMGAFTSFVTFIRSGKVDRKLIRLLFPLSLLGSAAGVGRASDSAGFSAAAGSGHAHCSSYLQYL